MAADAPAHAVDELEPPGFAIRPILLTAVGLVAFLAVSLALLAFYFGLVVPDIETPRARPFPAPRLETSIDPRMVAAVGPGPATPKPPRVAPAPERIPLDAAMSMIAAKGAQGYDPIAPPPGSAAP